MLHWESNQQQKQSCTVLVGVEGILNSKPLGYVSSDLADPDPVTPNMLLMGRPDSSLPQAIYSSSELLGRRKWHHSQQIISGQHLFAMISQTFKPGKNGFPRTPVH